MNAIILLVTGTNANPGPARKFKPIRLNLARSTARGIRSVTPRCA